MGSAHADLAVRATDVRRCVSRCVQVGHQLKGVPQKELEETGWLGGGDSSPHILSPLKALLMRPL